MATYQFLLLHPHDEQFFSVPFIFYDIFLFLIVISISPNDKNEIFDPRFSAVQNLEGCE